MKDEGYKKSFSYAELSLKPAWPRKLLIKLLAKKLKHYRIVSMSIVKDILFLFYQQLNQGSYLNLVNWFPKKKSIRYFFQ